MNKGICSLLLLFEGKSLFVTGAWWLSGYYMDRILSLSDAARQPGRVPRRACGKARNARLLAGEMLKPELWRLWVRHS
jgi:hypothetical protein